MDRMRPSYVRQQSNPGTPGGGASPTASPFHRHARSGSSGGNMKKAQTKAAAQRLAQVMAHQLGDDDDDDDDDLSYEYNPVIGTGSIGLAGGRAIRARSPLSVRSHQEQPHSAHSSAIGRPLQPMNSVDQPSLARISTPTRSSHSAAAEQSQPSRTVGVGRSPQPVNTEQPSLARISTPARSFASAAAEQSQPTRSVVGGRLPQSANSEQPLSARISTPTQSLHSAVAEQSHPTRSVVVGRSSLSANPEQPPSARSTSGSRPYLGVKTVPLVPASVPISLKPPSAAIPTETPVEHRRDKSRMSLDWDNVGTKETSSQRSASALQDELDMLQEENDSLLEKLQLAEERCDEAEAKAQQLKKQISSLGEGVTLEARLFSRKEAALRQREAALRAAGQTHGGTTEDVTALRIEAEIARDEATSAWEKLHEVQTMTQRTILTQEEMEEVVLKRSWLARYWSLCIKYGIHAEIAEAKYEHWSSFAPCPAEVVLAAGQKAKEENSYMYDDMNERDRFLRDKNEHSGELNIESLLLVEKGLRELASLKLDGMSRKISLCISKCICWNSVSALLSDNFT